MLGICVLTAAFIFLLYGLEIVGSFTKLWGVDYALTMENYIEAFRLGWDYMQDLLILAAIATPFTGLLGMSITYVVKRKRFIGSGLIDVTSILTFAAPGTVVGLGYILAFNQKPLMLSGTGAIIVLLFIFRDMPVGIRAAAAVFEQIDVSLDQELYKWQKMQTKPEGGGILIG